MSATNPTGPATATATAASRSRPPAGRRGSPRPDDFAQVPAVVLPVADDGFLRDLTLQVGAAFDQAADLGCDDEVYDFTAAEPPPEETGVVSIDVMPGSDRNPVNVGQAGVIPVAVLSTSVADGDDADFDATTVDVSSVRFGPGEAAEAHGHGHLEDVDGDGDVDLVLHFRTSDSGIQCGDTEVTLTGMTSDGRLIAGGDTIDTLACYEGVRHGPPRTRPGGIPSHQN